MQAVSFRQCNFWVCELWIIIICIHLRVGIWFTVHKHLGWTRWDTWIGFFKHGAFFISVIAKHVKHYRRKNMVGETAKRTGSLDVFHQHGIPSLRKWATHLGVQEVATNIGIPLEVLHRRCLQNSQRHRPTPTPRTLILSLFFFFSLSLSLDLLIHTNNDKLASCFFFGMRIMGVRCEPVFSRVFSDPFKPEVCFFSIENNKGIKV